MAIFSRKARLGAVSFLLAWFAIRQHLEEILGQLAVVASQLADIAIERVARLGQGRVVDAAKQVVGR